MEGVLVMASKVKRRARRAADPKCPLCGEELAKCRPGIRPAFVFRDLILDREMAWRAGGPKHPAGTEICGRHQAVWDVAAGKMRAVWAGEGGGR